MAGISAKLPLSLDPDDGIALNKDFRDSVRQNLVMLVLTVPGERIMIPDFGVGLKAFLFENDGPTLRQDLTAKIREQVSIFIPFVEILEVRFKSNKEDQAVQDNLLHITIEYSITPLDFTSQLVLVADEIDKTIEVRPNDLTTIL